MSQPLLSILIPTVIGREKTFNILFETIRYQSNKYRINQNDIEVIVEKDNKETPIGRKRDNLYKRANGVYSVQWDDDDFMANDAIDKIMLGCLEKPDCVTYEEYVNIDGEEFRSNHSLKYDDWCNNFDGYDFCRTPFFKSVIRTDIAQSIPVPSNRWGEDIEWAKLLKPHLKTEVHIPEQIYKYIHISSDFNERYGIK